MEKGEKKKVRPCWDIRKCSPLLRKICPAFEFNSGNLCWFINGTLGRGQAQQSWGKKMKICRKCEVFIAAMKN